MITYPIGQLAGNVESPVAFHVAPTIDNVIGGIDPTKARTRNATAPLTIPSYDGSNQLVEPSVVCIPSGFTDANGNVWYYLMSVSGYFQGNANFENPQIRGSVDGKTWSTITGAADPLIPQPGSGHNYDSSIALGPDGRIYITTIQSGTGDGLDHYYWIASADLVNWGNGAGQTAALNQLFTTQTSTLRYNTLNIGWDGTRWHMWGVRYVGGNALLHWTAPTIAALGTATPTVATITIPGGRTLWESNIIRLGGQWVGLITTSTDTSGSGSYLHLMTSPDGNTWTLEQYPILRPMTFNGTGVGGTAWDAGQVYRAGLAGIASGRAGPRIAIWYSAQDGGSPATWKVGYTEAWFANDASPDAAQLGGNAAGQWYPAAFPNAASGGATLSVGNLFLAGAYSGEDGIAISRLGASINTPVATAILRMGIYIINDQLHPFQWTTGVAWATLVSEASATIDCSQVAGFYSQLMQNSLLYVPPRTWFAIAGVSQTAAANLIVGKPLTGVYTPLSAGTANPYNSNTFVALFQTGVTAALPSSFVPSGGSQADAGVGYQLAGAANQPTY